MDPQACLDRILDTFAAGNLAETREAAKDLREWIASGGFSPTMKPHEMKERVLAAVGLALVDGKVVSAPVTRTR